MADVRGYVYEHRFVAAEALGRLLLKAEMVHHIDRNRQNNSIENLEVVSPAQHRFRHRIAGSNRKAPDTDNPITECGCGCGARFNMFDSSGRPRRFVTGHNMWKRKP